MLRAILLHGKPTEERYRNPALPKPHEANWFPWLGDELKQRGVDVCIPALPSPYFPVYETWREMFARVTVDENTSLVGHSAGAEFILRWLSEHKDKSVERVVLVAPWTDGAGKYNDFSHYSIDDTITDRVGKLTIINSRDDSEAIQQNVQRLIGHLPTARLVQLDGFGHFMIGNNMAGPEFPELLEALTD